MATLSVSAPDAVVPRIVAAVRARYPAEMEGLTDSAAVKKAIALHLKSLVATYEANLEVSRLQAEHQAAIDSARTKANTDMSTVG